MHTGKFRVGGVPEHFNYPWYLTASDNPFFEWEAYPGGTGAMGEALREGQLDVALMLTEGAVADIHKGNPSQIVGTYVQSPLTWGIHVGADSPYQTIAGLEHRVFGISRYTSGSHLMAYVNAQQQGWDASQVKFEVVGDFEGARKAMQAGAIDAFMWEKFTTKPLVDSGEWRRVGVCVTPWPCFVLVARQEVIDARQPDLLKLMHYIQQRLEHTPREEKLLYISEHFNLQAADVADWYEQTTWSCSPVMASTELDKVQHYLKALGVIDCVRPPRSLCAPFVVFAENGLSEVMYNWRVESVYKKLAEEGLGHGKLSLADLLELGHLDQYHYLGADACYEVAEALDLKETDQVYDVGSGVGGTGRVLADCSGAAIVGVELQPELCRLATELTERVGLQDRVTFKAGDFLNYDWEADFDHFISLLVFLHVPDRRRALEHCYQALKPGGQFFIEDFVLLQPPTPSEQRVLKHTVSARSVTHPSAYEEDLRLAGFEVRQQQDMTAPWREWTKNRFQDFRANAEEHRAFFGEGLYNDRLAFYKVIAELFEGGHIGGLRITGAKKQD